VARRTGKKGITL